MSEEWISVKDRLPEEGTLVLTYGPNGIPTYKVDYKIDFPAENPPYVWGNQLVDEYEIVTHWMPLPEPPK